VAARLAQFQGGRAAVIPHFIRADFASSMQTVFHVLAGVMAVGALVAFAGLRAGRQEESGEAKGAAPAAVGVPAARGDARSAW